MIIFDLDDTLIDTSGCITPVKLEMALERMMARGLSVTDPLEALQLLKRLDMAADSAHSTLSEFLEILGADEKFYSIGIEEIYGKLPEDIAVFPIEEAVDILIGLKENHQIALVTIGKSEQQMSKMKKAGIDSTIFSKIIVSESQDKKPHYKAVMESLGFLPSQTIVLGDRVALDLSPAKELGCKTIQMRWGRGLNPIPMQAKSDVDFTITELKQIKEIISLLSF